MIEKRHLLSLYVYNKPGVLSRISGVFGRLGCNIKSLCVAETTDPNVSRITLISLSDSRFTEKIMKNLDKLVDVIEVQDIDPSHSVERETMLVRIAVTEDNRADVMRAVDMFGCLIVSMSDTSCILQINGSKDTIETVLSYLSPLGIEDLARTGVIALRQETQDKMC